MLIIKLQKLINSANFFNSKINITFVEIFNKLNYRGTHCVPLFIKMTFKEQVEKLLQDALDLREDLFLIEFKIDEANKIKVVLDGDNGVNLQDCIDVSRAIEHNLDKDVYDFGLDVASSGVSTPLTMSRQFIKNIGRKLSVKTDKEIVIEAELTKADEQSITLEWKAREPKKIGKGKETVEKIVNLPYSEIKEATVVISF